MNARPATIDELAALLDRANTAADVFGSEPEAEYRRLAKLCHPDRFHTAAEQATAQRVFVALTGWWERLAGSRPPAAIDSPRRQYAILRQVAEGDLADVHLASSENIRYVLKICRPNGGNSFLMAEDRCLRRLAKRSGDRRYREYLPIPVESFLGSDALAGRQINVFAHRDGFHTLEAILARHPAGLDARHLAWIFKRMLVVAGFAHTCGLVHGAILPPHVMLHAENHGLQLVDWTTTVPIGQRLGFVPARFRDWYPPEVLHKQAATAATDIFLAAKSLLYIADGDPRSDRWPDSIPREMRQFLNTCFYPSPRMRPQNAWQLHEEFDELLRRVFGEPKYHTLVMA